MYDNCPDYLSKLLEKAQRNVAVICTGAYSCTSNIKLLSELGWTTLKKRREYYKIITMYKIINNLTQPYLRQNISFTDGTSNLRNQRQMHVPLARTVSYLKSFFPSAIRLWNTLGIETRNIESLASFKNRVKHSLFPESNPLYCYGSGRGAVHQARIRMGLSGLNYHRHKYKFIPSPRCDLCGSRKEDPIHYFLLCPSFTTARQNMLGAIFPLIRHIFPMTPIHLLTIQQKDELVSTLLNGNSNLNIEENKIIFDKVHQFILQSKRFK